MIIRETVPQGTGNVVEMPASIHVIEVTSRGRSTQSDAAKKSVTQAAVSLRELSLLFSSRPRGSNSYVAGAYRIAPGAWIQFSSCFHVFYLPIKRNGVLTFPEGVSPNRVAFGPGMVGFIPSGGSQRAYNDAEVDLFVLGVDPMWLAETFGSSTRDFRLNESCLSLRSVPLESTLRSLIVEVQESRDMGSAYVECLIRMACIQALRIVRSESAMRPVYRMSPVRLRRVVDYLELHLSEPISTPELALQAKMSVRHFCRCFLAETGMTPHRYLQQARIERAKNLMRHGDATFAQVARTVGFRTHAHFCHVFKTLTGQTPRAYSMRCE
jgi:AraC family transcriptional regulator